MVARHHSTRRLEREAQAWRRRQREDHNNGDTTGVHANGAVARYLETKARVRQGLPPL